MRLLQKMTGGELRRIFTGRLAQNTLLFTLVIALILVFTLSWLVLIAEQGAPNANIKTYHDAVWWAFVTITTVGYGDFYPVTGWGQSFAVILMFLALASLVYYQAISHLRLFPCKEEGKRNEGEEMSKIRGVTRMRMRTLLRMNIHPNWNLSWLLLKENWQL